MRIALTKLLSYDAIGWSCAAGTTGLGAMISSTGEVAMQLLGVPLPVVLAAVSGSFLARAYAPATNFWGALAMSTVWTIAGCSLAPIASPVAAKFGFELPAAALAGVALAISLMGPMLLPILVERAKSFVRGKQDGGGQTGGQP